MRATTRFLLLGALAMCLSACLPEPPMGSDAAIFKRPSRYGWGASGPGRRPGPGAQPEQAQQQQQRTPSNRFGHTDKKPKPNNSSSNSSQGSNSDSGSTSTEGPSSIVAADDDDKKKMTGSDSSSSNSGSSSTGDSSSGGSNKSSSSTPPSNLNDYPYARLVPGKKGAVTLPGVGEIDVTGIKPGTPVEIDDPNNPGKKIYFRVP